MTYLFHSRINFRLSKPFFVVMLTSLVCIAVWLLLIKRVIHVYDPDVAWVNAGYSYKTQGLAQLPSPRIVIVAGSSALFGIDSEQLSSYYHLPTYNMGLNAGMLTPYILDKVKPSIRSGDIILAPMEYSMYLWDGGLNQGLIKQVLANDPAWMEQRPWLGLKILVQTPVSHVLSQWLKPSAVLPFGLYGPHHMNALGDQTNASKINQTDQHKHQLDVESASPQPYTLDQLRQANNPSWQELINFRDYVQGVGACLIFMPPPMVWQENYVDLGADLPFYRDLPSIMQKHGLYYVGVPSDFLYDKTWFFDTNYHLQSEYRSVHTNHLITILGNDLNQHCQQSLSLAHVSGKASFLNRGMI